MESACVADASLQVAHTRLSVFHSRGVCTGGYWALSSSRVAGRRPRGCQMLLRNEPGVRPLAAQDLWPHAAASCDGEWRRVCVRPLSTPVRADVCISLEGRESTVKRGEAGAAGVRTRPRCAHACADGTRMCLSPVWDSERLAVVGAQRVKEGLSKRVLQRPEWLG